MEYNNGHWMIYISDDAASFQHTNHQLKHAGILHPAAPAGALEAFLSRDGFEGVLENGSRGGGGVLDSAAGGKSEDGYFGSHGRIVMYCVCMVDTMNVQDALRIDRCV